MLNSATSIHLWNNFSMNKHNIDFNKINPDSLYQKLYNLIHS